MKVVGLMSGTSADAVDAALVEWPERGAEVRPFALLARREDPLPAALRARVHALAAGRVDGAAALEELVALDVELAERFANSALAVMDDAGIPAAEVAAVASHGQTVGHYPEHHGTLQIGSPALIAERTGCTTVADFRPRDLAAGGEGAPLAPFFHWAAFASERESRLVLNLGGIANLSFIPRGGDPDGVRAFDVGPANALIDGVVCAATDGVETLDRGGRRAAGAAPDPVLLARLLEDDFLRQPPPKSTGRERYGTAEAEALLAESRREGRALDVLLATLVALTAEAVVRAREAFLPEARGPERLLVGGGGVRNRALMEALAARLPGTPVEATDALGVPADAAEAMAFSLLGRNALLGIPNHLPRCTGARAARVLGAIVPA